MSQSIHCKHNNSCFVNVLRKTLRGVCIGLAIKVPLSMALQIMQKKDENEKLKRKRKKLTASEKLKNLLQLKLYLRFMWNSLNNKDTGRFVTFFSIWIGSYPALLCFLRRIRPNKSQQAMNYGLAGSLSALSISIDTPGNRRREIAVYIFTRAVLTCWKLGVEKKILPSVPFGEILVFCFIAAIIQYTFIFEPDLMRKQFYRMIDDLAKDPQGRLDKFLLNLRRQYHTQIPEGYQVMERSSCNSDYYYTGQMHPPDPNHYFSDAYKPYMTTGDCKYLEEIEKLDED